MERQNVKKGRGIWSVEEDKTLVEIVHDKRRLSWNEVAVQLNARCGFKKTGKQCRERYRNYANPDLEKSEWKPREKLLFLVLHQFYGNQWSSIAKHMNQRSDVVVKNYFYSATRKAMKQFKSGTVPAVLLKKPSRFYLIYIMLEHIRVHYLPVALNLTTVPKYSHKEKIILNLLRERNVTDQAMKQYEELMIKSFQNTYSSAELPKVLDIDLKDFAFIASKAEELIMSHDLYNPAPLNKYIVVNVNYASESEKESPPSHSSKHLPPLPATTSSPLPPVPAPGPAVGSPANYYVYWNTYGNALGYMSRPLMPMPMAMPSPCQQLGFPGPSPQFLPPVFQVPVPSFQTIQLCPSPNAGQMGFAPFMQPHIGTNPATAGLADQEQSGLDIHGLHQAASEGNAGLETPEAEPGRKTKTFPKRK